MRVVFLRALVEYVHCCCQKMDDYEGILLVKPEVFVYKVPPRTTNRGYRAADWNLQTPDWTGRMRLVTKGKDCVLKLEDKSSGELFAKCPIDKYPGIAVEAVMDSSRYFVIRIQDDTAGRAAFIGIGFGDRGDSFDFNVALQDHFKWLQKTEEIEKEEKHPESKPQLDLGFKEGQTITINMKIGQKTTGQSRPKAKSCGSGILLPPPPGGSKIAPPPSASAAPLVGVSHSSKPTTASPQFPRRPSAPSSHSSSEAELISILGDSGISNSDVFTNNGASKDQSLLDL